MIRTAFLFLTGLVSIANLLSLAGLVQVNFPEDKDGDLDALDPPPCLAVSAKRYVLFNRQSSSLVIRKASGHGLGHLLAPHPSGLHHLPADAAPWRQRGDVPAVLSLLDAQVEWTEAEGFPYCALGSA